MSPSARATVPRPGWLFNVILLNNFLADLMVSEGRQFRQSPPKQLLTTQCPYPPTEGYVLAGPCAEQPMARPLVRGLFIPGSLGGQPTYVCMFAVGSYSYRESKGPRILGRREQGSSHIFRKPIRRSRDLLEASPLNILS